MFAKVCACAGLSVHVTDKARPREGPGCMHACMHMIPKVYACAGLSVCAACKAQGRPRMHACIHMFPKVCACAGLSACGLQVMPSKALQDISGWKLDSMCEEDSL
eukprot:1158447-Pelagomonas_calceolata.AAC.2